MSGWGWWGGVLSGAIGDQAMSLGEFLARSRQSVLIPCVNSGQSRWAEEALNVCVVLIKIYALLII